MYTIRFKFSMFCETEKKIESDRKIINTAAPVGILRNAAHAYMCSGRKFGGHFFVEIDNAKYNNMYVLNIRPTSVQFNIYSSALKFHANNGRAFGVLFSRKLGIHFGILLDQTKSSKT